MITYKVQVTKNSTTWHLNGKMHREDGPAVENSHGGKAWYINGKRHREDGPAVEYTDGIKYWYINDELHRENGPAIEYSDGTRPGLLTVSCTVKMVQLLKIQMAPKNGISTVSGLQNQLSIAA
jgi:hypothetical protein